MEGIFKKSKLSIEKNEYTDCIKVLEDEGVLSAGEFPEIIDLDDLQVFFFNFLNIRLLGLFFLGQPPLVMKITGKP